MPAYFSISLQFKRSDIYDLFVKDFHSVLDKAGVKFKSGYWGFEGDSCEEIIEWNQKKLEQNFKLGYTQHHKHDYKQTLYDFGGFTEVRGFWMNNYPEKKTFSYEIIIPEDDVLSQEYPVSFKKEKMNELLEAMKKIWQFPYVRTIQTGLEGDTAATCLAELAKGERPNIRPFAVIEENLYCFKDENYLVDTIPERKGVLLKIKELGDE